MDPVAFRKTLAVLKRQWWVILQAMVVVGLAAGWQASRVPAEPYQASASVLVRAAPDDGDLSLRFGDSTSYIKAQLKIMRGPIVTAAVAEKLPGVTADELAAIDGTSEQYSSTFTITATNYDADRAIAIVNAYGESFVEIQNEARTATLTERSADIEAQLAASQERVASLTRDINVALFTNADTSALEAQRDAELRRFQGLFDQQQTILTQEATRPKAAELLESATAATQPPGPNVPMRAALGAVLGLFIGGALAGARELLDDKIRTPDDAAEIAGVPTISQLPKASHVLGTALPVFDESERALAEAFRSLRTSVRFLGAEEPLRAVAVTSPEQGDGKSLVSSNLAAAFAMTGSTTVLVSGDLRRPQLDAAFGVSGHLGLADLLVDQHRYLPATAGEHDAARFPVVKATDFLCETEVPNLWILPSGTPTPNPAELLGSPYLTQVIDDIVKFADMVIIDCPPTVVTDGVVLSKLVDGAIVVTSMVKTHKSSLRAAIDRLTTARVKLLGVVANRATQDQGDAYGYGYYEQTRTS
ncbi:MAG: polysaccharide biosynthesis tyrosine autokinase [Acidimicrobiia bacterium]